MALQISVKAQKALQILEQQSKKNQSKQIKWQYLTKNKTYNSLFGQNNLISSHQEHQKRIKNAFKKAVQQINLQMVDKTGNRIKKFQYIPKMDYFLRHSEYQQIINQKTLLQYVQNSPKGVLISNQILQFTYKDIDRDIQKLLTEKKIKKINSSNKKQKQFYIFSNRIEREYGLLDRYDYFGQKEYISLCKENYKYYEDMNEDEAVGGTNMMFLATSQRFNQWVPQYAQLKREWLLKNQQKEKLKNKN